MFDFLETPYNPKVAEFYKWLGRDDFVLDLPGLSVIDIMEKVSFVLEGHGEIVNAAQEINDIGCLTVANYGAHAIEVMK